MQGSDPVAVTRLDVLSSRDKSPVGTAYEIDGERTTEFPTGERLLRAKPVIEYLEGFGDVSHCRRPEDLPAAARNYIRFLEEAVGCPVEYVSVGAEREEYVKMF